MATNEQAEPLFDFSGFSPKSEPIAPDPFPGGDLVQDVRSKALEDINAGAPKQHEGLFDFSGFTPRALDTEDEPPMVHVEPGALSRLSEEEASRRMPRQMSLEPSMQEIESIHPALNSPEYYEKRREVAKRYNRADSNEERIDILQGFTNEWMPAALKRATGKTDWGLAGAGKFALNSIATGAQWLDNVSGRWVRALINTTAEDRRKEIAQGFVDVHSPSDWWDRFSDQYKKADGGIHGIDSDGERTYKNAHLILRSMSWLPVNKLGDEISERWIGGKDFGGTGKERLAAIDAEASNLFQFGADSLSDLGFGLGGIMAEITPNWAKHEWEEGVGWKEYMNAREEAAAEGSVGGHEFIGLIGQVMFDPLIFLKAPKIASLAGVRNTKYGAGLIDELLEKEVRANLQKQVRAGNLTPEEAADAYPRHLDGARSSYGKEQIDAANVAFQHEMPNFYGVEAPRILSQLKNPMMGHVVDDILEAAGSKLPSRRPGRIDTSPGKEGLDIEDALTKDEITEQAAMETYRAEEAWAEIVNESIRRKQVPKEINVQYKGVDVKTMDNVWAGSVKWETPVRFGKETAEQAFKRNRMLHSMDNVRTKMVLGLMKRYPYLESMRRTAESIIMLEKAQPMASKRAVGDVNRSVLVDLERGIREGRIERTPEIDATMAKLSEMGDQPSQLKWATYAPKGVARHGVLHQAAFRNAEMMEVYRHRKATLSAQDASNFYDKVKRLGADDETLRLAVLFKELGRHDPATAGVIEKMSSLDRIDQLYQKAVDGDFAELPPQFRSEMEAIAAEHGFLDNWMEAARSAEESYLSKRSTRKEAWQTIRRGMFDLRKSMKNTLADIFARESEVRVLNDMVPVRTQIRELMGWRQEFADLIKNRVWTSADTFEEAISRINDFRIEQTKSIDEMISGGEGADINRVFEGYRRDRILPEGTKEDWSKLRDDIWDQVSRVIGDVRDPKTGKQIGLSEVWMDFNDMRARTWAEWHRLPEDMANAWYAHTYRNEFPLQAGVNPEMVKEFGRNVLFSHRETGKVVDFYEAARTLRLDEANKLGDELGKIESQMDEITKARDVIDADLAAIKKRFGVAVRTEGGGPDPLKRLGKRWDMLLEESKRHTSNLGSLTTSHRHIANQIIELAQKQYKLVNRAGDEIKAGEILREAPVRGSRRKPKYGIAADPNTEWGLYGNSWEPKIPGSHGIPKLSIGHIIKRIEMAPKEEWPAAQLDIFDDSGRLKDWEANTYAIVDEEGRVIGAQLGGESMGFDLSEIPKPLHGAMDELRDAGYAMNIDGSVVPGYDASPMAFSSADDLSLWVHGEGKLIPFPKGDKPITGLMAPPPEGPRGLIRWDDEPVKHTETGITGLDWASFGKKIDELEGAQSVAKWLAKNTDDEASKHILRLIIPVLDDASMTVRVGRGGGDGAPWEVLDGRTAIGKASADRTTGRVAVWLRDDVYGDGGLTVETAVHELLHAATLHRLELSTLLKNKGSALYVAGAELRQLLGDIGEYRIKMLDEYLKEDHPPSFLDKGTAPTSGSQAEIDLWLTSPESRFLDKIGGPDEIIPSELLAWGLTNKKFQDFLIGMKIEGESAWTKFVRIVSELLGIKSNEVNALTELLRITEDIVKAPTADLQRSMYVGGDPVIKAQQQIRSPEFQRWFGDSKVVDEAGEPLRVYHGTMAEFEAFSPEFVGTRLGEPDTLAGEAYFFVTDKASATYIGTRGRIDRLPEYKGLEVYLKIENPMEWNPASFGDPDRLSTKVMAELIPRAKELGHDGVVWRSPLLGDTYVAFKPTQIKSTRNVGTFDPKDPRILFSRAEQGLDPLAYTKFEDGKAVIGVFENVKGPEAFTALMEELGHIFRRDLPKQDMEVAAAWVRRELKDKKVVNEKTGRWSELAEEAFARAFVKWVKTGEMPPGFKNQSALREVFQKAKDWLFDVYYVITGREKGRVRAFFGEDAPRHVRAGLPRTGKPAKEIKVTKDLEAVFHRLLDPESLRGQHSPLVRELDDSLVILRSATDDLSVAFAFMRVQASLRDLSGAAGRTEDEADALLADLVSKDVDKVARANRSLDAIKRQASGRHRKAPSLAELGNKSFRTRAELRAQLKKDLTERLGLRSDEVDELLTEHRLRAALSSIKADAKLAEIPPAVPKAADDVAPIIEDIAPAVDEVPSGTSEASVRAEAAEVRAAMGDRHTRSVVLETIKEVAKSSDSPIPTFHKRRGNRIDVTNMGGVDVAVKIKKALRDKGFEANWASGQIGEELLVEWDTAAPGVAEILGRAPVPRPTPELDDVFNIVLPIAKDFNLRGWKDKRHNATSRVGGFNRGRGFVRLTKLSSDKRMFKALAEKLADDGFIVIPTKTSTIFPGMDVMTPAPVRGPRPSRAEGVEKSMYSGPGISQAYDDFFGDIKSLEMRAKGYEGRLQNQRDGGELTKKQHADKLESGRKRFHDQKVSLAQEWLKHRDELRKAAGGAEVAETLPLPLPPKAPTPPTARPHGERGIKADIRVASMEGTRGGPYTVTLKPGWLTPGKFSKVEAKNMQALERAVQKATWQPGVTVRVRPPKKVSGMDFVSEKYPSLLKHMAKDYVSRHPAMARREVRIKDLRSFNSRKATEAANTFDSAWAPIRGQIQDFAYRNVPLTEVNKIVSGLRASTRDLLDSAYRRGDPRRTAPMTDLNAALVGSSREEVASSLGRFESAIAGAKEEVLRLSRGMDDADPLLQDAADIAAIKPAQASDETVQRARDAITWIDGQIKDRDTFIRSELTGARKEAKRVRRVVDGEEADTVLGEMLGRAEGGIRVVDAKSELQRALDTMAPPGREMGPRAKVKHDIPDVTKDPKIVVTQISKQMDEILDNMPETREAIMGAAKEMGYDLRTPGEMWNVILNAKKWARSYGDELTLRREIALEAFRHDETMRIYDGLDRATKGKVERLLKNRKLYGVAKDAPPQIKALAKELGMIGEEELFITLKRGRVKVGSKEGFTDEQIEKALKAASLLDDMLEKQLKEMTDAGILVGRDPLILADIDILKAERTLSRDPAERKALTKKIVEAEAKARIPFDKEAFLTRANIGSYIPHIRTNIARGKTAALLRGGMPSTKKGFFEHQRTKASVLDDINEQKRDIISKEDLYHNAMELDRPAWGPGAPFSGMDPELVKQAALEGRLESLFSVDGWERAVSWSRNNLTGSELYEFFEPDFKILTERYIKETNRRTADAIFARDIREMFPVGEEIAKMVEGLSVAAAEIRAREFGYSRLSKYDSVQSATGIPLPKELQAYEDAIMTMLRDLSPEEVASTLRARGISVDVVHIEAMKGMPYTYAPTPYVEYLRWINKPDWAAGNWWMGWLDGFHAVAKSMATISSIAHIALNVSGNHASIAQKLGAGVFNPANHADAMMIFSKLTPADKIMFHKKVGVKHVDSYVTIGNYRKTVGEWREAFDIAGISEAPLSRMYLEEMGAIGPGRTSPQLAGAAAGAGVGAALGGTFAGPIGAAAGGFIGQYPGALLGEILSHGFASDAVKGMSGLSKAGEAVKQGWNRVWFEEMDAFRKAIDVGTAKGAKRSVQYFGERAVGMTAAGAIGSVFGAPGVIASAIAGLSLPSYMRMMTGLNQAAETQARITLAVGELRAGKTLEEAAASVDDALRNYSHLTPVEKHTFRRLFFFYTWDAGNMRFQIHQMIKKPRQAAVFGHFLNGIFKGQFNEEEIQAMPEYLRWQIMIRTGPATAWSLKGLPQQAFIEMLGRWSDGKPAGLLMRARPDLLTLFEFFADKKSVYYGRGWDELSNVKQLKDASPFLKKVAGFPVKKDSKTGKWVASPGQRPVFDKNKKIIGWKDDYRAMHPENFYLMTKLPGYRIIGEQLKLQKSTFTSRATEYEDPADAATGLQRAMAFLTGNRPYSLDFENQLKYYEWEFLEELQRQIKIQDKTFFVDIKRAVRRIPPKDGELEVPSYGRLPVKRTPVEREPIDRGRLEQLMQQAPQ